MPAQSENTQPERIISGQTAVRLLAAVLAVMGLAAPAGAAYTLRVTPESSSMAAGTSQRLSVELVADANEPAIDLYGFDAQLDLIGPPDGVRFSAAEMPPTGYIFQDNSFYYLAKPVGAAGGGIVSFPSVSVALSDSPNDPFPISIAGGPSGSVWQLGIVTLTAASDTPAGPVTLGFNSAFTLLDSGMSDSHGNPIGYPVVLSGVEVQVTAGASGANPAPAPPGLLLALSGIVSLGGFGWLRRRKTAAAG